MNTEHPQPQQQNPHWLSAGVLSILLACSSAALAHGTQHHDSGAPLRMEQKDWGIAAPPKTVQRTVTIRMSDQMRFTPDHIVVKEGERVRLTLVNEGHLLHEFVLGTPPELEQHAALMAKFPDMQHDEPYMVHVPPGESGSITWHFNRAGEFQFACLIAGHYQAGMVGVIRVNPRVLGKRR